MSVNIVDSIIKLFVYKSFVYRYIIYLNWVLLKDDENCVINQRKIISTMCCKWKRIRWKLKLRIEINLKQKVWNVTEIHKFWIGQRELKVICYYKTIYTQNHVTNDRSQISNDNAIIIRKEMEIKKKKRERERMKQFVQIDVLIHDFPNDDSKWLTRNYFFLLTSEVWLWILVLSCLLVRPI